VLLSAFRSFRHGLRLLTLFALIFSSAFSLRAQDFQVDFTGKLLGYYRSGESATTAAPMPVRIFLDNRKQDSNLLLGMGDNFGTEFGSRDKRFEVDCVKGDVVVGAKCNDVASFLQLAGYLAIVPGREDFGESAFTLRNLAEGLRNSSSSHNNDHRIDMLAANLRIAFSVGGNSVKDSTDLGGAAKGCPLYLSDVSKTFDSWPCTTDKATSIVTSTFATQLAYLDSLKDSPQNYSRDVQQTYAMQTRNTALATETGIVLTLLKGEEVDQPATMACLTSLQAAASTLAASRIDSLEFGNNLKKRNQLVGMVRYALSTQRYNDDFKAATKAKKPMSCRPDDSKLKAHLNDFVTVCNSVKGTTSSFCNYMKGVLDAFRLEKGHTYTSAPGTQRVTAPLPTDVTDEGTAALLELIAKEQENKGYIAYQGKVLVIGIVGRETMQSVRPYNLTLCTPPLPGTDLPDPSKWDKCPEVGSKTDGSWLNGQVSIADPIATVELLLRALDRDGTNYDKHILMAQMPRTEAEEVAAHVHNDILSGAAHLKKGADLDLVLSEAQADHASEDQLNLRLNGWRSAAAARVLTPFPPYSPSDPNKEVMRNPLSVATVADETVCKKDGDQCKPLPVRYLHHAREDVPVDAPATADTLTELADALFRTYKSSVPITPNITITVKDANNNDVDKTIYCRGMDDDGQNHEDILGNKDKRNACELVVMYRLLEAMRMRAHADVAFLERRDFFFGWIPPDYDTYNHDPTPADLDNNLNLAMEQALWIDDTPAEVMVSGKDLATILTTSQTLSALPSQPIARDVDQQWLQTEGIVTTVIKTPTPGLSADAFTVSGDPNCHDVTQEKTQPAAGGIVMYCVNGLPLQPDHAYWIATTDHLVQDGLVYTTMSGEAPHYAGFDKHLLPTLAEELKVEAGSTKEAVLASVAGVQKTSIPRLEGVQQQNSLFQLDFGKLVAAYVIQMPVGGVDNVSNNFQGVTDSTASSAPSKTLDAEVQFRLSRDVSNAFRFPKRFIVGIQEDFELTGTWTASLTTPDTPVPWSYSANSFTIGGFVQHPFSYHSPSQRSLPMLSVVLAPFQYQRNIRSVTQSVSGATGSTGPAPYKGTVPWGFSQRVGLRYAFDGGKWYKPDAISYAEMGFQYNELHDVVAGLNINGTICPSGIITFSQCASNDGLILSPTTPVSVIPSTQNSLGGYWDINLQKGISQMWDKSGPAISLIFASKGDMFANRPYAKSLSSLTRFDVPLSLSMTFPVLRNLSFAPTYQAYLYENQVAGRFLVVHSANISIRWYLDRDSHVPLFWKQFRFIGPASANQSQAPTKP
jgi:hypothetical protein